ncbi:MAG: hypothetical protein JSS50_04200 [Proteobacteria bacterium]|nr:hypothetical protein [Pseudomonadota bacterium]
MKERDKKAKSAKKEQTPGELIRFGKWAGGGIKSGAGAIKDAWINNVWTPYLEQPWREKIVEPWDKNIGTPFSETVWTPFKTGVGPAWGATKKGLATFGTKIRNHDAIFWKADFLLGVSVLFAGVTAVGGIYTSYLLANAIANYYYLGILMYGSAMIGGVGLCSMISYSSYRASEERWVEYGKADRKDMQEERRKEEKSKSRGKQKEVEQKEGQTNLGEMIEQRSKAEEASIMEEMAESGLPSVLPEGTHVKKRANKGKEGHGRGGDRGKSTSPTITELSDDDN